MARAPMLLGLVLLVVLLQLVSAQTALSTFWLSGMTLPAALNGCYQCYSNTTDAKMCAAMVTAKATRDYLAREPTIDRAKLTAVKRYIFNQWRKLQRSTSLVGTFQCATFVQQYVTTGAIRKGNTFIASCRAFGNACVRVFVSAGARCASLQARNLSNTQCQLNINSSACAPSLVPISLFQQAFRTASSIPGFQSYFDTRSAQLDYNPDGVSTLDINYARSSAPDR